MGGGKKKNVEVGVGVGVSLIHCQIAEQAFLSL